MKKYFFTLLALYSSLSCFCQVDSTTPPYKKFPTLPPLQILLGDSTTLFTKQNLPAGKPVLLMLFSPDCSHCQHEAEQMHAHKTELENLQVVMATLDPLWKMNEFIQTYRLQEIPNLVVGKDIYFTLLGFYDIRNLPFHALYDKKANLLTVFAGVTELSKLLEPFRQ